MLCTCYEFNVYICSTNLLLAPFHCLYSLGDSFVALRKYTVGFFFIDFVKRFSDIGLKPIILLRGNALSGPYFYLILDSAWF